MYPLESLTRRMVRTLTSILALLLCPVLFQARALTVSDAVFLPLSILHLVSLVSLRHHDSPMELDTVTILGWPGNKHERSKFGMRLLAATDVLFSFAYALMAVRLSLRYYNCSTHSAASAWLVTSVVMLVLQS